MVLFGNVWPILLCCYCFFISLVKAQASTKNPFIWQILAEFDLAESNKTKYYLPDTSLKIYSQDFQTVFENKDYFGYNERLVMDFGDACEATTIEDIQRLNGNLATSPSMMSQPSLAIVQRSGRCQPWSEKISTVQSLSKTYSLQITGIMIYDHLLYNDTAFIQEQTSDPSYPTWSTTHLPDYRNIDYMKDENVIDHKTTFVAVYFVPKSYVNWLYNTLFNRTFENTGSRRQTYVQLTFSLTENHFAFSSDPSDTSLKTDDNKGDASDNLWVSERDKRNYIIYSVTAAVIIILVIVILRWCRAMHRPELYETTQPGNMLLLTDIPERERHLIQFGQLSQICPIMRFDHTANNMTNTVCAVCLDDFKEDYYVRILPCHHGYCTACIDVWLTKKSSLCPFCKYDCRLALEAHTEKDTCGIELQNLSHAETLVSNEDPTPLQNDSNCINASLANNLPTGAITVVDHVSQVEHR